MNTLIPSPETSKISLSTTNCVMNMLESEWMILFLNLRHSNFLFSLVMFQCFRTSLLQAFFFIPSTLVFLSWGNLRYSPLPNVLCRFLSHIILIFLILIINKLNMWVLLLQGTNKLLEPFNIYFQWLIFWSFWAWLDYCGSLIFRITKSYIWTWNFLVECLLKILAFLGYPLPKT